MNIQKNILDHNNMGFHRSYQICGNLVIIITSMMRWFTGKLTWHFGQVISSTVCVMQIILIVFLYVVRREKSYLWLKCNDYIILTEKLRTLFTIVKKQLDQVVKHEYKNYLKNIQQNMYLNFTIRSKYICRMIYDDKF